MTYSKFNALNNFEGAENVERIYIFNDSTLILPVIKTEMMPKNGILVEAPNRITNFKNTTSFIWLASLSLLSMPI